LKTRGCCLFILLFLLSGIFFSSCTQRFIKPSTIAQNNDIKNLLQEALKLYHQGRLADASQKLEIASKNVPKDPPTWSAAIFFSILALLQEKSGDAAKSSATFEEINKLLVELKGRSPESEMQVNSFTYYGRQLKGQDQVYLLQKLAELARRSQGKAEEAFFKILISEVCISLNNFQEAYTQAIEALKLSKEVEDLSLEVMATLNVSGSLVALGKAQEAVTILHIALDKVKDNSKMKANVLAQLGLAHGGLGFEDLTLSEFREALNLASSIGDRELVARFHWKFALAYFFLNKRNDGIEHLNQAIKIFEQLGDRLTVAILEGAVANNYLVVEAFEDAKRHASHAAEIYNRIGNRIEEAKNLRIIGQSLWALNKVDDALKTLEKAALIQIDAKDRDGVLETLWAAVFLFKSAGRIEAARQVLLMGLKGHTSVFSSDLEGERKIRWELAEVCDELGLYFDALEQFTEVLSIYDRLSDKKGKVLTILELARVYAELNDFQNRVTALYAAEKIAAEIEDPFIKLMVLNPTAAFFDEVGDKVEALQRYMESIEVSRLISKQSEAVQLGLVGLFYGRLGEHAKALQYLEEELKIDKEVEDQIAIASCLSLIGFCNISMGKYDAAIGSAREAIQIIRSMKKPGIRLHEFYALMVLALALKYQGKYEDALKTSEEWLEVAEKLGNPVVIKDVHNEIGLIYLGMGQYTEAIEKFKKAIQITESLRWNVGYEEHKMGFLSKHSSPYDGIIQAFFELALKTGFEESQLAEEALSFAEKNKGRVWAEHLSKTRAGLIQESVPLGIRNEEKDLRNKFLTADKEYKNALTQLGISAKEIKKKEKALGIAFEKWGSFMEKVRRQYPKYALLQYHGYRPLQLNELTVRDGETLVLYKVTPDWVYAWVVRRIHGQPKILKFTELPYKTREIAITIDKLLSQFRRGRHKEFDTKISNELFDKILKPALEGVDVSNRLIIMPDGMLNLVPFEVLVTGTGCDNGVETTCFLGDQFIINYYPSAAILTFNREPTPQALPPAGSLFAVADPIYGAEDERLNQTQVSFLLEREKKQESNSILRTSGIQKGAKDQGYNFKRLKHTGVEVQKILDVLRNSSGNKEVLVGFDASEDRIKSRDLVQYRYLHFAVHGILAYDLPNLKEPALVLGIYPLESTEDGFLTVSEIYGLKLNADLVTLSACETALGPRVQGEGVVGLSRAFMIAGAHSVVVSLWKVDDHSTALLMEEFYKQLVQGVNKVEALVKAKQKLRQMGYENPYFWGPFILIGD
jgi:CHAT domain-containing protein